MSIKVNKEMYRFTVPSLFSILPSNNNMLSNVTRYLRGTYKDEPRLLNTINGLFDSLNKDNNPDVICNLISVYQTYLGETNIDEITHEDKPLSLTRAKREVCYPLIAMVAQSWNAYYHKYKYSKDNHVTIDVNDEKFRNQFINRILLLITTLFHINEKYGSTLMNKLELVNYIDGLIMVEDTTIELYPIDAGHVLKLLNTELQKDMLKTINYYNSLEKKVVIGKMNAALARNIEATAKENNQNGYTHDELSAITRAVYLEDFGVLFDLLTGKSEYYICKTLLLTWYFIDNKRSELSK